VLVAKITCPRCRVPALLAQVGALTYRCPRCEWPFTLAAPTVTAPAVPTSGTATTNLVANTTGTVVDVNVTGGTVTKIYVSGTDTGQTSGHVYVPAGGTVSITYSAAPTWTWALPVTSAGVSAGGTALPFTAHGDQFAVGQVLIVDPSGTPDVVAVSGTPTGTSVPVNSLGSAHSSGVSVTVAQASPELGAVEAVPQTTY
jgi:hypothetical protein